MCVMIPCFLGKYDCHVVGVALLAALWMRRKEGTLVSSDSSTTSHTPAVKLKTLSFDIVHVCILCLILC